MFEPHRPDQFGAAMDWMVGLLAGGLAVAICVLAVALVGFAMLSGRLVLRRGALVVLGCFVLLGAPAIAAALVSIGEGETEIAANEAPVVIELLPREETRPATYNPYAGASLRRGAGN